jgi:hypothetical protein
MSDNKGNFKLFDTTYVFKSRINSKLAKNKYATPFSSTDTTAGGALVKKSTHFSRRRV